MVFSQNLPMYVLYKKKNILNKSSYAELGIKLMGHLMVSSSSAQI